MLDHSPYKQHWDIEPGVTFLNHGSLGPTPRVVLESKRDFAQQLSSNPLKFMTRRLEQELDIVHSALGAYLDCDASDLVVVHNATFGMNAIAQSTALQPGDEILLNDHEYGAVMNIWRARCQATGAKLIMARLPDVMDSPQQIFDAIFEKVTPQTKMIVFSHVTSPSSLIFPAAEICAEARSRKILSCIDGPHALALLPVSLRKINCDYYTASCHKWLCAPAGSGFLYVRKKYQSQMKCPLVSWGRSVSGKPDSWKDDFIWPGTFDPSSYLAIPAAIQFLQQIGHDVVQREMSALAHAAATRLTEELKLPSGMYAATSPLFASMVTLPLPENLIPPPKIPAQKHLLQQRLAQDDKIEVVVTAFKTRLWIRISTHLYNDHNDIEKLLSGLQRLIPELST